MIRPIRKSSWKEARTVGFRTEGKGGGERREIPAASKNSETCHKVIKYVLESFPWKGGGKGKKRGNSTS